MTIDEYINLQGQINDLVKTLVAVMDRVTLLESAVTKEQHNQIDHITNE